MDSVSLLVQMEKNLFVLHVGFYLVDVIMGTCFRPCGRVYLALGNNPTGYVFGSNFFGI